MVSETSTQPSKVSTADTPPERQINVLTEDPGIAAARKASEAAPGDQPGQTSGDSATPPDKSKPKPPRNRSAERRISKLTKRLDVSQATNAGLREELDATSARLDALESNKAPTKEPQLKDFETPPEYAEAHSAWKLEQSAEPPKPGKPSCTRSMRGLRSRCITGGCWSHLRQNRRETI